MELGEEVVRAGPHLRIPAEVMLVGDGVFDPPQWLVTDTAGLRILHRGLYRAARTGAGGPMRHNEGQMESVMDSIQVPDEVTIQVNMHEVQVHVIWEGYDIALPLHILRQLGTATDQLVEQVGGPLTADEARRVTPEAGSS